ncbi:MAG: hypothetical protein K9W43_05770 [Candidatus Thorarchaeota archaeon]|nr:hypothetical protein [Candidatus Thorarchaeota archaeon]
MKNRWKIGLGLLFAVLMLQPTFIADVAAQQNPTMPTTMPTHPQFPTPPTREQRPDGTMFIRTDIITIMATSQMPMFQFWFAADENGTIAKFSLAYLGLVEFEDANGDGAYQSNETLYYAPLAAYDWTLLSGTVESNGTTTEVWLKYVKGGVRSAGMVPGIPDVDVHSSSAVNRFADVTLQIWAHIYLNDYEGNVTDDHGVKATYLVQGNSELKMDIEIGNFPFSTNTSSVALQTLLRETEVTGAQNQLRHRFRVHERTGDLVGHSGIDWNSKPGNETRFQDVTNTAVQKIDLTDATTGVPQGFYSWVDQATVTWPGGETEAVNVTASYVPAGVGLAVYLAYPNFDGGSLLHDPSIGVYPDAAPTTQAPLLDTTLIIGIGLFAVIAVAAIVIRRR